MTSKNYTTTPPESGPQSSTQTVIDLLQEVRRLVAFHQAIGIAGYPSTPKLAKFIAARQPVVSARPQMIAPIARPAMPETTLSELYAEIADCQRCPRHQARNRPGLDQDKAGSKLLIIGDFPSAEDGQTGLPMSGEPGLLLDKMLAAIGLSRAEVHLSLLTRCQASALPEQKEVEACLPFLLKEIILVAPKVICTMGTLTAQKLLHTSKPLSQLRGRFHDFQGIPLMPTFSLEFLLKNPELKPATWVDLQLIQKRLKGTLENTPRR